MLNDLFSRFDELARLHGVEKIKAIGDCYMAVCGLPERRPHHAADLAAMTLDMLAGVRGFNQARNAPLELRIQSRRVRGVDCTAWQGHRCGARLRFGERPNGAFGRRSAS